MQIYKTLPDSVINPQPSPKYIHMSSRDGILAKPVQADNDVELLNTICISAPFDFKIADIVIFAQMVSNTSSMNLILRKVDTVTPSSPFTASNAVVLSKVNIQNYVSQAIFQGSYTSNSNGEVFNNTTQILKGELLVFSIEKTINDAAKPIFENLNLIIKTQ